MTFEEALKAMREGEIARLDGRDFMIDACGDLTESVKYSNEQYGEFWCWTNVTLESHEIMAKDWEII